MSISVCIATYNGEKYIKAQLESILMQLGEEDEVVISDDASTDNTIAIIRSIEDPRIRLFTLYQALKRSYGFNLHITNSKRSWKLQSAG